jgi:hypothetical protein
MTHLESDSSGDDLFSPSRDSCFVPDLADIEMSDDKNEKTVADLRGFEARFTGYLATIGTTDLFTKFLTELRLVQRLIQRSASDAADHLARLRSFVSEIELTIPITRSILQIEALVKEVNFALATCKKTLVDAQLRDGPRLEAELSEIAQQWKTIQAERARDAAERVSATLVDELRQFEELSNAHGRVRGHVLAQLSDVHTKIAGTGEPELAPLIAEQGRLIERLAKLL